MRIYSSPRSSGDWSIHRTVRNAALTHWSESPRPGASHPQLHVRIVVVGRQELFKTPTPVLPHRTLFQGARHRQFQALPSVSGARVETHSLRPPTCARDEDGAESLLGLSQMTQLPTQRATEGPTVPAPAPFLRIAEGRRWDTEGPLREPGEKLYPNQD